MQPLIYRNYKKKNKSDRESETTSCSEKTIPPYIKTELHLWFDMQYWKVKTKEGQGVLHVLFRVIDDKLPRKRKRGMLLSKRRRGFIPHSWLSKTWEKIHGAKVVEIHELKGKKSERDIAYYIVGNYVSKQPIERISYSHKWVCVGFSTKWKNFLVVYGKRAVEVWNKWLLSDFKSFRYQNYCVSG